MSTQLHAYRVNMKHPLLKRNQYLSGPGIWVVGSIDHYSISNMAKKPCCIKHILDPMLKSTHVAHITKLQNKCTEVTKYRK